MDFKRKIITARLVENVKERQREKGVYNDNKKARSIEQKQIKEVETSNFGFKH